MYIQVNGVKLFVETVGAKLGFRGDETIERPTILLLHGGPGLDHSVFRPAFEPLSEHAQLVMYDHRGSGRSEDGPKSHWHMDQWADDVAGVIETLDLQKPIVLGTSFGGFVAQRFAAKYPDLLSGLVLMATTYKPQIEATLEQILLAGGMHASAAASDFFTDAERPGVVEKYFETCLQYYAYKGIDAEAMARIPPRPEVMMHFFRKSGEMYQCDFSEDLKKINVPTLLLHGEKDVIFPPALAEETLNLLAAERKHLALFKEGGHLLEQDVPDDLVQTITRFFELKLPSG
ncbi:alpha/beta hydrolase [Kordiimonas sp. SCSIO 12603]|uniref:alpha/beta fold hydrolase n=1 Tax=Kordiimonas sp. SCSIO 12603 TaxID=2829596 RepID=UPI0021050E36|nr:alpha/beta hydrolase [Kordiimonas sp. SCSIO 12603]UTW58808.1 alpha/beta hydrolase [Kordiimonas sp. SCSIO 12603]